ncbi:MAG: gliding motility lipoprotein GldH [Chlorobi bacterium]|nr:gliding motility lipoprotein GldH [Chlorobiota bacterium]
MKKHISNFLLFAVAILLLISCSDQKVFEQYHKFEKFSWNRFEFVDFETQIEDTESEYDIYLNLRHLPEYPYRNFDFNFTIYTPSGEMRTSNYEIKLYDNQGNRLSECLGDYCDMKIPVRKGFRFSEPGTVKFEIENRMTKLETPGVMEVGLIIEKSEKRKE